MLTQTLAIPGSTPGTTQALKVLRFGVSGARPQVYVQASLHADEIPGMICAHHLRARLVELEAQGQIAGEIILVPVANPLGLMQTVHGHQIGRFALSDGGNFNRDFASLTGAAAALVEDRLTPDAGVNVALIRQALRAAHGALAPVNSAGHLKHILLGLALDADLVLDLHCDSEAVMHLYTLTPSAETFAPLARLLGAQAVLLADESGGDPFDEAVSRPWADLARRFPGHPVPLACQSTTVELRGHGDVDHAMAAHDAAALVGFMIHAGAIAGAAPPLTAPACAPTQLASTEPLVAPVSGMLVYAVPAGAVVAASDLVCEIIDPLTGEVTPVVAQSSGLLFARAASRFATPGKRLGKIAGSTFRRSGPLLSP